MVTCALLRAFRRSVQITSKAHLQAACQCRQTDSVNICNAWFLTSVPPVMKQNHVCVYMGPYHKADALLNSPSEGLFPPRVLIHAAEVNPRHVA
jgi:hypothetical protein